MKTWLLIGIVVALGFGNVLHSAWHQDWTYDEPFHTGWSRRFLETGEMERTSIHNYSSTTPVTFLNVGLARLVHPRSAEAERFWTRFPTALWWLVLLFTVGAFARSYLAPGAAGIAIALAALDPSLRAHASLATVDVAFSVVVLWLLWATLEVFRAPTASRVATLGAALGLAYSVKYSALLVTPFAFSPLLYHAWKARTDPRRVLRLGLFAVLVAASAIVVINAAYAYVEVGVPMKGINHYSKGFAALVQKFPDLRLPFPKPFLSGLDLILSNERTMHWNAVVLGETFASGVWYYFLVVWMVKTPLALLLLATFGLRATLVAGIRRDRPVVFFLWIVLTSLALYFSLVFRTQVGLRYMLMCVPLAYLIAAEGLAPWLAGRHAFRVFSFSGTAAAIALVCLVLVETLPYAGNPLAFTNSLVWPKKNAYRWIADSNIDWGQNYGRNERLLTELGLRSRYEPIHLLEGENVFRLNTVAGVWWNFDQHRWLREHARPASTLGHTYLRYQISRETFDAFLETERRRAATSDPYPCGETQASYSGASAGPLTLDGSVKIHCFRSEGTSDLVVSSESGSATVGFFSNGTCGGEEVGPGREVWFRLAPGTHPVCVTAKQAWQGSWRIDRGQVAQAAL